MKDAPKAPDINEDYFSEEARWQSWLDVEAMLAMIQSDMGIIPEDAGAEIAKVAKLSSLNLPRLRGEIETTMAPVFALTEELAHVAGNAGDYVHWGATTQNIIETGRLLVLKRVHSRIKNDLKALLTILADQAEEYAQLVMVGRTNRQNALPITYGFKIAGWIDELMRVNEQLNEVEKRLFQLRFGGAIGAYHSLRSDGEEISRRMAARFDLIPGLVPNRTSLDPLLEYITKLSLLGAAIARMSGELYLLTTEEIGEVKERHASGVVGSSTMPQKVNPKLVVHLNAKATQLRAQASAAFAMPCPSHEGDSATNQYLSTCVVQTCGLAIEVLENALETMPNIQPDQARIAKNFAVTRQSMALESLMMLLATEVGRSNAHSYVHSLSQTSVEANLPLLEVLKADEGIGHHLREDQVEAALSHEVNIGCCTKITHDAVSAARALVRSS